MSTMQEFVQSVTFTAKSSAGAAMTYELKPNSNVFIGSSSNCGFRLADESVSSIHCHLTHEQGKVHVKDWMSAGGTFLDEERIVDSTEVQHGSIIKVGTFSITLNDNVKPRTPSVPNELERNESNLQSVSPAIDQLCENDSLFDLGDDFFDIENADEEQTYDHATVALLRAEIDDLRCMLAQRDADATHCHRETTEFSATSDGEDTSERMLKRMQDLIDEATHSDERISLLEELLHAAEDANRYEQEERTQLEAWVSDIENRIIQREEEQAAEVEALRGRLEEAAEEQRNLQRKLKQAAENGNAGKQYDETLELLQRSNDTLRGELAQSRKVQANLEQRVEQLSSVSEHALREERASIAKEQAKLARMRYEISQKLAEVDSSPKMQNSVDHESAVRIQALRNHLREIHEQERLEERESSLTARLAKLWKRVE